MSADGADIRLTDGEVLGDTAVEALEPEYSEAERFARELVRRSASLSGVRIDRAAFSEQSCRSTMPRLMSTRRSTAIR